jgi:LmbE family N-acetylglucosaminyl deacetylase
MRRLMAVFAHPDDETYATGGTLARYASEGVRCSLYCGTDGDAGQSSGIPVSTRAELGALRRAELRAACDVLGIQALVCRGHPDGDLHGVDPEVVMGEIVAMIRREQPEVVITFGPEGAPTRHRDHRAISRLATAAFLLAGNATAYPEQLADGLTPHRPAQLWYSTWLPPAPGEEPATEGQPIDVAVRVTEWLPQKRAAFEAHRSQHVHRASFDQIARREQEYYFVVVAS